MAGMINNHDSEHGSKNEARMASEQTPGSRDEAMVRKPQIAKHLFVTERTVENYMRLRKIPFVKSGRLVFFKPSEVEAALFRKVEPEEKEKEEDKEEGD